MIQTTLFLADEHLKKLTCHRCGGRLFVPHPLAKVAKEKNTGKRYLQYLNEKNNNYYVHDICKNELCV